MKYGAKNADNPAIRYDQTTKIIERFLADTKASKQSTFWLESCNVCACCCGIEAAGGEWKAKLPVIAGKEVISQADLMFDFLYSTDGRARLPKLVDGVMENELPENLVFAINECSTAKAKLHTFTNQVDLVSDMKSVLRSGSAIALSYLTDYNTGHFISIVQYDEDKKVFIGYDSWKDNMHCKNGGVKEEYLETFIIFRSRPRFIEIARPA